MNRVRLALAVAAFLLPAAIVAQPSAIRIRSGEMLEYDVRAEIEVTEVAGPREETVRAETGGVAQLTARRVSRGRIEWSFETPDVRIVRVTSAMEPGQSDETTVQTGPAVLRTDARGRVVSSVASVRAAEAGALAPLLEAMNRSLVRVWFQPAIFRRMKPGAVWSEKRDERLRLDELGIDVRTRYTVDYRFDGIVDTLGTKAVRVSWSATEMSIDGTRRADGVTMPVEGDGDHSGTSYFSTIDGLLLASSSQNSVDIRVSPHDGGGRVIPVSWRVRAQSIRK